MRIGINCIQFRPVIHRNNFKVVDFLKIFIDLWKTRHLEFTIRAETKATRELFLLFFCLLDEYGLISTKKRPDRNIKKSKQHLPNICWIFISILERIRSNISISLKVLLRITKGILSNVTPAITVNIFHYILQDTLKN